MQPRAPVRRRHRGRRIAIATVLATTWAGTGIGSAHGGGGVGTPDAPALSGVSCLARCGDLRMAAAGSTVELSGSGLDAVDRVKFAAAGGGRVGVAPSAVGSSSVEADVPVGAATGTVRVVAYGLKAETPPDQPLEIVDADQLPAPGEFKLTAAEATPHHTYFDGRRKPKVSYVFQGAAATDVRVEVVDRTTKAVVTSFVEPAAQPSAQNVATWNGRLTDGSPAADGDYRFRLGSVSGGHTETTGESRFEYHTYRFPLDARHSYGDGFGAGRGHEGQDVFAKCGTPIHAVRGGRVQANDYQSAAGNYLVIDGKGTKLDTFYAHMVEPSPLRPGTRVRTGKVIGNVGQTGNATGCHLHFEIWSAPGWYEGGSAMSTVGDLLHTWDDWT